LLNGQKTYPKYYERTRGLWKEWSGFVSEKIAQLGKTKRSNLIFNFKGRLLSDQSTDDGWAFQSILTQPLN
jgi:hypothetical protein